MRGCAVGDVADARRFRRGQFQRVEFVVVERAQVDRAAFASALGQAVDVDEEIEAFLGPVGQEFDMAEVGHVEARFGLTHSFLPPATDGLQALLF